MMVTTGARGLSCSGLSSVSCSDFLHGRMNHAGSAFAFFHFKTETIFRAELLGDFFINRLVHGGENTQPHQIGDDLERLLLQLRGEFAHDNRRLDDNDLAGRGAR